MAVWPVDAAADQTDPVSEVNAGTVPEGVRVTVIRVGGEYTVGEVRGGGTAQQGCSWSVVLTPGLEEAPYGTTAGPKPDPDAQFALLLCDGTIVRAIWILPDDIVDLDAAARAEAERYVEDVLMPAVRIGVNPEAQGLAGLRSWFWIDGYAGSVQAPPITVFGLTIDVRMAGERVTWDFGDGSTLDGDLGLAYPAESTVQHAHRASGSFTIGATLHLVPEYRVDGGPWIALPQLAPTATATLPVEEREPVITGI